MRHTPVISGTTKRHRGEQGVVLLERVGEWGNARGQSPLDPYGRSRGGMGEVKPRVWTFTLHMEIRRRRQPRHCEAQA